MCKFMLTLSRLRPRQPSRCGRGNLVLNALEKVYNPDTERLSDQVQACQSDVHPAVLESADLCAMEARFIGKLILREPLLLAQRPNASAQPLLNRFPLQQEQFRGILRKRILLIRRVMVNHVRLASLMVVVVATAPARTVNWTFSRTSRLYDLQFSGTWITSIFSYRQT